MGAIALDASVAIAFLEPTDAHHKKAVASLRESSGAKLIMAASAYSETLVRPLAKGLAEKVDAFISGLRVEIVPLDREIARSAARLRAEHRQLRLPDALVLATAQLREASLLTFDARQLALSQS